MPWNTFFIKKQSGILTPIQGKHLISSGSKATSAIAIRSLAGLLMEIMNFFLCVCVSFFSFFLFYFSYFIYTHQQLRLFPEKNPSSSVFCIWGSFGRGKFQWGSPSLSQDGGGMHSQAPAQEGDVLGLSQGRSQLRAVPQAGTAVSCATCSV